MLTFSSLWKNFPEKSEIRGKCNNRQANSSSPFDNYCAILMSEALIRAGAFDSIDDHRARIGPRLQAIKRAEQQRLRFRMGHRCAHQATENEFADAVTAQYAVGDILRRGTRRGRLAGEQQQGFGKAFASLHLGQDVRGEQQTAAERIGRQRALQRRRNAFFRSLGRSGFADPDDARRGAG